MNSKNLKLSPKAKVVILSTEQVYKILRKRLGSKMGGIHGCC